MEDRDYLVKWLVYNSYHDTFIFNMAIFSDFESACFFIKNYVNFVALNGSIDFKFVYKECN